MDYIALHENEHLEDKVKVSQNDIECFKVIEERLTSSGRIEYWTFPIYAPLPKDVVESGVPQHPQQEQKPKTQADGFVQLDEGFVHAYRNLDDAVHYMETSCIGYDETRPVVYRCVIPKHTQYFETYRVSAVYDNSVESYAASQIKYVEPIYQRVWRKTQEWKRMEKPDKKKKFGIIVDENQINGDVNNKI
ncbi:MAG: hypothetical protein J6X18_12575 [Bacteroidales bacterium]|nr:hypothetical protein [Bacteroidales bacterium]